MCLEAEYYRVF